MKTKYKITVTVAIITLLGASMFLISAQSTTSGHSVGDEIIYGVNFNTNDISRENQSAYLKVEIANIDSGEGMYVALCDIYAAENFSDLSTSLEESNFECTIFNSVLMAQEYLHQETIFVNFFAEPGFQIGTYTDELIVLLADSFSGEFSIISINETYGIRTTDDNGGSVQITEQVFNADGILVYLKMWDINTVTNIYTLVEYSVISYTMAAITTTDTDPTDITTTTTTTTTSGETNTTESNPADEEPFTISGYPYVVLIGSGAIYLSLMGKRKNELTMKS